MKSLAFVEFRAEIRTRQRAPICLLLNCAKAGGTCFCVSMNTGPKVAAGFDIALTELADRRWDSCFTMDFCYIRGGSVRPSARSRYRQWMTHKLAT